MIDQSLHALALDIYRQLLDAWNRRSGNDFAELFGEEGSCIGFDGSQMNGRVEIAASLNGIFADHPTAAYVSKVREVRLLDATTILIRAVAGMVPPGSSQLAPAANAIQSVVAVNSEAGPRIALFQNTPAAFHGRPELAERLSSELSGVVEAGLVVDTRSAGDAAGESEGV